LWLIGPLLGTTQLLLQIKVHSSGDVFRSSQNQNLNSGFRFGLKVFQILDVQGLLLFIAGWSFLSVSQAPNALDAPGSLSFHGPQDVEAAALEALFFADFTKKVEQKL